MAVDITRKRRRVRLALGKESADEMLSALVGDGPVTPVPTENSESGEKSRVLDIGRRKVAKHAHGVSEDDHHIQEPKGRR